MTDIIVIGGGIAGVSAAARLAPFGKVTLLEREGQLAYHASGRSSALYEPNYGKPAVVALSHASGDFFHQANGGVLSPRGVMMVAKADELEAFEVDCATFQLDQLTPEEARSMIPILNDQIAHAAHHPGAFDIDTDRLIQNFARDITRNGGQIVGQAEVTRIARTRLGWEVRTGKNDIYGAKLLVNAAGAWADEVALMARVAPLGLQPMRRSMGRVPAPDGIDVSGWPMLFGPGETWYAKPDAGALIVSPAEEFPMDPHDAFADDMTLAEGFARFGEYTTYEVKRLLASWGGLRTFAPDRQLVLGPDPSDPTFIWSAGQGGYGFQTAPAASQLVADLAMGQNSDLPNDVIAALSPVRFR